MTILVICADEKRLEARRAALHQAKFHIISARSVAEAWDRVDFFEIWAVVIDHDLAEDISASAFRQRFMTLTLEPGATPEGIATDLAQVLRGGSELVH